MSLHLAKEKKQCSNPEAAAMSAGLNVAAATPATAVDMGQRETQRQCKVENEAGALDWALQPDDKSSLALQNVSKQQSMYYVESKFSSCANRTT
jgi:hypothetical protein